MSNLISYLNNIKQLEYFDPTESSDFTYLGEVNEILDNYSNIINYFTTSNFDGISSIDDFMDYLCLKKIIVLEEYLYKLKKEDERNKLTNLIAFSKSLYDLIQQGVIIKFINLNYEVLLSDIDDYKYFDITYEFCQKYQNGMGEKILLYLIHNHSYKIFYDYDKFQKKIEKEITLFKMLFSEENIILELDAGHQEILDIIISIKIRKKDRLYKELSDAVDAIDSYGEKIYQTINKENVLFLEGKIRIIFEFFDKIQDVRANKFNKYYKNVEKILIEYINEYGQKSTYEIPVKEVIKHLKNEKVGVKKLIMITHSMKDDKVTAILNKKPSNNTKFYDLASSNISTSDYYTLSHQDYLNVMIKIGSVTIDTILLDKNMFQESLTWYSQLINHLCNAIECDNKALIDEFILLHQMLQNVYLGSDKDNDILQQSLCYGTAIFICAYIEKLLRTVYMELKKDKEYISIEKLALGQLLSDTNQLNIEIFGKYQLNHLRYFLLTDGQERIGYNYRNRLAHWRNISVDSLDRMLVAELMYLLTSVINSLAWYFAKE